MHAEAEVRAHLHAVEPAEGESLAASDGAVARLEHESGEERLVVRDRASRILFEYFPETTRCVVHAPTGDLVLRADDGAIALDAAKGLTLRGGPKLDVEADAMVLSADDAEATIAKALVRADVLDGTYRRVRNKVDILETRAGRIVEKAKETYREVQHLSQTRAGRLRFVAEKTFHVMSTRTLFKAHKDVKIKGDKIHLG